MKDVYTNIEELDADYQKEKERLFRKQNSCQHLWSNPIRDDRIEKVGYGLHVKGQGSDCWSEYEGYTNKQIPRWKRICKLCGKIEYTEKQGPVISSYKPSF